MPGGWSPSQLEPVRAALPQESRAIGLVPCRGTSVGGSPGPVWEDQAAWVEARQDVETALTALAAGKATSELHYFQTNRQQMRYGEFRARGCRIGSGTVESACKQVIGARLMQAGMRWSKRRYSSCGAICSAAVGTPSGPSPVLNSHPPKFWRTLYVRYGISCL